MNTLFPIPKSHDDQFETFWQAYPRHRRGNKQNAYRVWREACKRSEPEVILAGCIAYAKSNPGMYAKGCAAWLADDRWTWEYEPAKPEKLSAAVYNKIMADKKKYSWYKLTAEEAAFVAAFEKQQLSGV